MSRPLRILIVDDSEEDVALLQHTLCRGGYEITCEVVDTPAAMRCALENQDWDVITSDHSMPHFSAPAALALANELRPDVPFMILSGEINLNLAVSLMRAGAKDYIQKGELVRLVPAIERELREAELRRERLRVDAALVESEEKHRFLVENSHDIIYTLSAEGIFTFVSPSLTAHLGYTPTQLVGEPFQKFVHPDDHARCLDFLRTVIETGQRQTGIEYRVRHVDGSWSWHTTSAVPIRAESGDVVGYEGTARDITGRKKAEEALQKSKNQYDRLIANIPVGVYTLHSKAQGSFAFEYISPKVEEIFAVSAAKFLADPQVGFEPIHPDDLEAFLKLNQARLNQPHPFDWEGRAVVNGVVKWLRIQSTPEALGNGDVLWHGIVADISEQKQLELARQIIEEKFYVAFHISPDAININRLSDGLYLDINQGFTNLSGYTSEDVAGKTSLELDIWVNPQDRERLVMGLREQGEVSNLEAAFRGKNGQIKTCLMSARVIELNQEKCILSITRDITERKQTEEQIWRLNAELEQRVTERTAQLTAANQEMEAFSYSVSHDLRAPLRALEGFSRILLEDYAGALDEQGRHYLSRIQEASRRMEQLIDDLLKLSRLIRADFRRQPVDLSSLATRIAAELQSASPQHQVVVEITPGLIVQGDGNLLKIVLENLLTNAYKFTGRREQAVIQVGVLEQAGKPVYFVRDNGAGFNATYADRLFAPFHRLHSEKEFPGTGIGLATVKRIIHRHGGRVWAEGSVDKGAIFYFTLA